AQCLVGSEICADGSEPGGQVFGQGARLLSLTPLGISQFACFIRRYAQFVQQFYADGLQFSGLLQGLFGLGCTVQQHFNLLHTVGKLLVQAVVEGLLAQQAGLKRQRRLSGGLDEEPRLQLRKVVKAMHTTIVAWPVEQQAVGRGGQCFQGAGLGNQQHTLEFFLADGFFAVLLL
ncbi:hypothetical protein B7939_11855, partial [Eggerthia catenaformis]